MLAHLYSSVFSVTCSTGTNGITTCDDCNLRKMSIEGMSRQDVLSLNEPVIFTDIISNWTALEKWKEKNFFDNYGDRVFHLHHDYNETVSKLLQPGSYKMGHVLQKGSCYADPWRPYTPLLLGDMRNDYYIPDQFLPMSTFQIGVGRGKGVGVPPENHPSSWFAMVAGTKRWIIHPPSRQEPKQMMDRPNCNFMKDKFETDTFVCDQKPGEVLWLPNYWWHETCGLKKYSIGMGALTWENSHIEDDHQKCVSNEVETRVYSVKDIPHCIENPEFCLSLPYHKSTSE